MHMHENYFSFSAKNHYDLGLAVGKKFAKEANQALMIAATDKHWPDRKQTASLMLSISRKFFPQYIEELEGYAKGANVDFADFWTLSLEDDAFIDKNRSAAKCTTIVTNSGLLIGHNEDYFEPGFQDTICIVKKTIAGFTTLEIFYYNTLGGSSIGINSHGYLHAVNTLLYTSKQIGVPKSMIARLLLDTTNPERDLAFIQELSRASGFSHLVTDENGQIWHAEFTSKTAKISLPALPFCHTNHCLIGKSGKSKRNIYGTDSRLRFAQRNTPRRTSVSQLQVLLDDRSQGTSKSLFNERTIGRMIIDQKSKLVMIWLLREKELGWINYSI